MSPRVDPYPYTGHQAGEHLNIFLEYLDGGSLRKRLEKDGPMSEEQAANTTRKVLSGLSYLHSKDITHRDIKVWVMVTCWRRQTSCASASAGGWGRKESAPIPKGERRRQNAWHTLAFLP